MHCLLWNQIISSQLNLPPVDSNQVVDKDDRWSVKTGCTRAKFYGKGFENSSMYFLFLCLRNLQEFPANPFHSVSMGYCVQNHKIWMMWTLSGCISISNSIIIVFLMLSATTNSFILQTFWLLYGGVSDLFWYPNKGSYSFLHKDIV